jgi:photosystem I subunit 3
MRVKFQSVVSVIVPFFIFLSSFFLTMPNSVSADFQNLTLCKESPAFQKRLNTELKKLENRLKLYRVDSLEANRLLREIENTKNRFKRYGSSNLLCGKEGLPRIIASGQWDHANEFVIPGLLFLYITGWIGWVGRKYIIFAGKSENSFENEIILNIPVAYGIATSGFLWPIEAWNEFKNGELIATEDEITVSPR